LILGGFEVWASDENVLHLSSSRAGLWSREASEKPDARRDRVGVQGKDDGLILVNTLSFRQAGPARAFLATRVAVRVSLQLRAAGLFPLSRFAISETAILGTVGVAIMVGDTQRTSAAVGRGQRHANQRAEVEAVCLKQLL